MANLRTISPPISPDPSERDLDLAGNLPGKVRRLPAGSLIHFIDHNAWKLLVFPFLLFILLPVASIPARVQPVDIWNTLSQPVVRQAIQVSLSTSVLTVAITLLFGTPLAYYLSHPQYRLHRFVDTLVDLPTILPPSVAGIALLMAFGRTSLLGAWLGSIGVTLPFSRFAVVLAQLFVASPFYIKTAAVGFAAVDCELKKAAALDGASRWQTFRHVVVPMSWISLCSGSVMTWARALGEFGATIIFAGNFPGRTQTMPLAIYLGFEMNTNVAITLSIILVCISFGILIMVKGILHRSIPQ